jgi:UDP-GlcNAc:undecaprenyl-phosphate GlcNAc-1-phosphate transferase
MTTIIFAFFLALFVALFTTPLARVLGIRMGAMDLPGDRKVHIQPIPRIGGVGIFAAFMVTIVAFTLIVETNVSSLLVLDTRVMALLAGAGICFLTGIVDDFRGVSAKVKCLFQIFAATLTYLGGVKISGVFIGTGYLELGYMGYPATILWFLVFINAVNLIDGLDGLAGGITFIAAILMVLISLISQSYLNALLFAALAGSILGFLYYNFNPASIFLGDGGSYFIGFLFAGLSLYGSVKSHVGSVLLIPMIALGLPLFDVLLSSVRRFLEGKKIFSADKDHIHHRLVQLGLSTRRVVWLMYGISLGLCLFALVVVNLHNERVAVVILFLILASLIFARKLKYFDNIDSRQVYTWMKDMTEEAGISRERRSFMSRLFDVSRAKTLDQLWKSMEAVFQILEVDHCMLYLSAGWSTGSFGIKSQDLEEKGGSLQRTTIEKSSVCFQEAPPDFIWRRAGQMPADDSCSPCLYRIQLPLIDDVKENNYGSLVIIKDSRQGPIKHYSLKRIEHLRRAVISRMGLVAKLY